MLIDIEGGEASLLTERLFSSVRNWHIIVELHPWAYGYKSCESDLIKRAEKYFKVGTIYSSVRPNDYSELWHLPDTARLSAFSEGRPELMKWLYLSPRNSKENQRSRYGK